jgi:hypothetical protein
MPKRTVKRFRYESEIERTPLSPALERRLRKVSLDRTPGELAEWHAATDDVERFYAAPNASMAAYMLCDRPLALKLAREALSLAPSFSDNWNYGNAIHYGHTVLGLLALQDDKQAQAVAELHESGTTPGSPQLDSFGPTMHLARDLLRRGEHQAVLQYLQQCRRFWRMGTRWLDIWEKKVTRGAMPTFFMQLYR